MVKLATFTRPRRVIRVVLRKNSEADGVIADWIDELQEGGLRHSAAIRNILRAAISGHPFVTPLKHTHYIPRLASKPTGQASAEAQDELAEVDLSLQLTDADVSLLKKLRVQMGGK